MLGPVQHVQQLVSNKTDGSVVKFYCIIPVGNIMQYHDTVNLIVRM